MLDSARSVDSVYIHVHWHVDVDWIKVRTDNDDDDDDDAVLLPLRYMSDSLPMCRLCVRSSSIHRRPSA